MTARVTIVTRTRNRGVLLKRAVRSVARQTFTDYELVIVNDGGDAAEVDALIAAQPAELAARTTIVHNESSHGREAAVEDGLAVSTHEFFAIHDDDDSWEPGFLERTVAEMDAHPSYGAVAVRCDVVHEHLEGDRVVEDSREVLAADSDCWSLVDSFVVNAVPPISQLIRRDVADEIGHWDGRLQTQADWEFNLRLLLSCSVSFLGDEVLAHWHQRPAQGSDMGNSVIDDAHQHRADNLMIRDRYLRDALAAPGQHLGPYLLAGEYYKRLRAETEALHLALRLQDEQIHELKRSLSVLHEAVGAILQMTHDTYTQPVRSSARIRRLASLGRKIGSRIGVTSWLHSARGTR